MFNQSVKTMCTSYLQKDVHSVQLVDRKQNNVYKRETVLSTDVLPFVRARDYEQTLRLIAQSHKDSWYLHYHFFCDDAAEAVRRVPSVTYSFNRSRVLRRAQISGARMCNLAHKKGLFYYVTDMVVSCSFDALVFASLLNTFKKFDDEITIEFKSLHIIGRNRKRLLMGRYEELIEKFYRRSKLPRNSVHFARLEDEDLLGAIRTKVTTTKPLFDIVHIICDVLGDDVETIKFGDKGYFEMSRICTVELDLYTERPFDSIVNNFNYRKFSSFGCYANGQNIVNLKHQNL